MESISCLARLTLGFITFVALFFKFYLKLIHQADSKDSDQAGQTSMLI